MPIGARRMIHHSTFCTIASAERLNARNGSAFLPDLSAAMPMTSATTRICSTLKLTDVDAAPVSAPSSPVSRLVEAPRPRTLPGMRPLRKSSHVPVRPGSEAASSETDARLPGWNSRPRPMPTATEIAAVMANHSSV
ncbi:Uncharacterised protein [Mycobacteroides abscessus]|nr:Uncharacterised protein [Mycobacteroides abscessus]